MSKINTTIKGEAATDALMFSQVATASMAIRDAIFIYKDSNLTYVEEEAIHMIASHYARASQGDATYIGNWIAIRDFAKNVINKFYTMEEKLYLEALKDREERGCYDRMTSLVVIVNIYSSNAEFNSDEIRNEVGNLGDIIMRCLIDIGETAREGKIALKSWITIKVASNKIIELLQRDSTYRRRQKKIASKEIKS